MSAGKCYLLDSNVFIEAHQSYYAMSICPGFWKALLRLHGLHRVFSLDRIRKELLAGKDEISEWITSRVPDEFFKGTADKVVIDGFRELSSWVQAEPRFTDEAKDEFASVADGWLVAYARVNGLTVVTQEVYAPEARNRVKIPNVCLEADVEYCNTFELLKELRVQFVLRTKRTAR